MREQAYAALKRAYQQFLGRDPSDQEIEAHLGGDYSSAAVDRAVGFVSRSPEAEAYRQRQTTPPPTTPPPTTPPPTTPPGGAPTTDPFETRPTAGDFSRVEGYDSRNWGTMNSMKYRAGEILSRYPATPQGLQQAVNDPDFKRLFPNARLVGHDTIDFGGMLSDFTRGVPVGRVDVGRAFDPTNNTGGAWVWQDLVNTGATGPASPGAPQEWNWRAPPTTPPPTTPPPTTPPPPGEESPKPPPYTPELPPIMTLGQMNQPPQPPPVPVMPGQIKLSDLAKARGQRVGIY